MFSAVEDDLEVKFVPRFSGENFFQITFGLDDVFSAAELPAFSEAVDVGIDWKGGDSESLCHHHRCGFVANAG